MITKVTHASRNFTDVDAALKFYTELLGFQKKMDNEMGPGQRWLTVSPADQPDFEVVLMDLQGWVPAEQIEQARAGLAHQSQLMVATNDIEGLFARLKAEGVELVTPEINTMPWGRDLVFRDPSGSTIYVVEPPAQG